MAMIDHFAILEQPRRPWLGPEAVKLAFHRRSAELHPDVPGTGDAARFAELNAAHSVLREPAARLRHLLELLAPAAVASGPMTAPPPELADWFMNIALLRQKAAAFIARRSAATSPLARALLAGEEAELRRRLEEALASVERASASAEAELRALDGAWSAAEPPLDALQALQQRLSYLSKWGTQTREALFSFTG